MSDSTPDLKTEISGLALQNPIILGAGPLGYTGRSLRRFAEAGFGAVIGKTVTPKPFAGNPAPRVVDASPCCLINAEGLRNMGFEAFKKEIRVAKVPNCIVIASVYAESLEDFTRLAVGFEDEGADAVELDLGCPHTEAQYGAHWLQSLEDVAEIVKAVKKATRIPVWVKISSRDMEHMELAKAVEKAGADAIVPFPAIPGLPIDIDTGKPRLGKKGGEGSITGPALKYAGIKRVADIAKTARIPIVGTGGASSGLDVIEYLMAGARAVEIYTVAQRQGPDVVTKMTAEVEKFLLKRGYTTISQIVGTTLKYISQ